MKELKKVFNFALILLFLFLTSCGGKPVPMDLSKLPGYGQPDTAGLSTDTLVAIPPFDDKKYVTPAEVAAEKPKVTTGLPPTQTQYDSAKIQKNSDDFDKTSNTTAISAITEPLETFGKFYFSVKGGSAPYKEETEVSANGTVFRIKKSTIVDYKILTKDKQQDKTVYSIQDSKLTSYAVTVFYKNGQAVEIEFPSKAIYKYAPTPRRDPNQIAMNSPQSRQYKAPQIAQKAVDCGCTKWGPVAKEGLTAFTIAKKFNMSVAEVQRLNPSIKIGKPICLEKNCSTSTSTVKPYQW